jgi:hypothetical protein
MFGVVFAGYRALRWLRRVCPFQDDLSPRSPFGKPALVDVIEASFENNSSRAFLTRPMPLIKRPSGDSQYDRRARFRSEGLPVCPGKDSV